MERGRMIDERVIFFSNAETAVRFAQLEKKAASNDQPKRSVFSRLGPISQQVHEPRGGGQQVKNKLVKKLTPVQVPEWNGYGLIGDSNMVRISSGLKAPVQNSPLCRGGLTSSVVKGVVGKMTRTPQKVILLIGTNDILKGVSKFAIKQNITDIVRFLNERGTEKIVLLQLLPIANANSHQMIQKVSFVNRSISQMNGPNITVLELHRKFMADQENGKVSPNLELYEKPRSSHDTIIHAGKTGVEIIIASLKELLSPVI